MVNIDEDALECDLAETYHIYNYRSLPLSKVATFACGLRDSSRIRLVLCDERFTFEQRLFALAVDRLAELVWLKTEDAAHGRNKPKSIYERMISVEDSNVFESPEAFEKAYKECK